MTFLPLPADDELSADAMAVAAASSTSRSSGLSNTARTLLAHPASFVAYDQWWVLKDELVPYIGERAVHLFSYAISDEANAQLCAAYFRRVLVDGGEDPDQPQVTDTERTLLAWGRAIARGAAQRSTPSATTDRPELTEAVTKVFSPRLRTMLLAFAGQTIALTVFTVQGHVPIDDELQPFVRDERAQS